MSDSLERRRPVGLVVAASLAFACAAPLGKYAQAIPAPAISAGRTAVASLLLAVLSRRTIVASLRAVDRASRLRLVLAGLVFALHLTLFLGGLARTSLAAAVALVSLQPVAVVAVAFVSFGARPSRREVVAIALATAGAAVVGSGAGRGEHSVVGDVMVVASVALYGVYVAVARALRDALPAVPAASAIYAYTCMFSVLLYVAAWPGGLALPSAGAREWGAVALMGVVPTTLGHTLVQVAARRARPALVALVSPGETLGALCIGALTLGALPSGREAAGAALVITGATLAVTRARGD